MGQFFCTEAPLYLFAPVQTDLILYRFVPLSTDLYQFVPQTKFYLKIFIFNPLQIIYKG